MEIIFSLLFFEQGYLSNQFIVYDNVEWMRGLELIH